MGIRSVLGASECDEVSLAAKLADEVFPLGGNTALESYLDIEKVVTAAASSECQAVHPGYGFLSERPEFVQACQKAGLIFLGPSPKAMRRLGNKVEAKMMAEQLGVPLVPGHFKPGASQEVLKSAACQIGFPILLKASAGGGGRGMRQVASQDDFDQQFVAARDEAVRSFGDGELMVEKLVAKPRHIEVQIAADHHGGIYALYERECSLQRRRQKVVEEAGAVLAGFGENIWPKMRDSAVKMIQGADYQGVATAEFLVDEDTHEFYFLEVNARLQVEHPVTELVTGLDLVRIQIEIADQVPIEVDHLITSGNRDGLRGHAIEFRIIAEDPSNGFMPSIGKIECFAPPTGPGIRVDSGFQTGDEVSRYYDSLLAKLIVFGKTRQEALERSSAALKDFHILGVHTNIPYLLGILENPDFQRGKFDVNWLEAEFGGWQSKVEIPEQAGLLISSMKSRANLDPANLSAQGSRWPTWNKPQTSA